MKNCVAFSAIVVLVSVSSLRGSEPNETFATATSLAPGVLTVADQLAPGTPSFPDTLLGVRDMFGSVYFTDDDGSPFGDGHASGLGGVPTNSGGIDFSVTGYTDLDFIGQHGEAGQYEVFVDVYDFFGDLVDSFSEVRTLAPGVVHDFTYSDFQWINGDYDVYIDNTVGAVADVDFFTFTGLTAGAQFTARTFDPASSGVDTLLGWFNASGALLESDDDGAGGKMSLIDGTVPSEGKLTFAVSGLGDDGFMGSHNQNGSYELRLQIQLVGLVGDYNKNNVVDAADYVVWRDTLNQVGQNLPADGNGNGSVDPGDYTVWKMNLGRTASGLSSGAALSNGAAVPEPSCVVLILGAIAGVVVVRRRPA